MLRDRLVCGIANQKWQQRLLAEGDSLTYTKAHTLLLSLEAAEQQVKDIANEKPPTVVHQVRPPRRLQGRPAQAPTKPKACYRCGGAHDQAKCRFRTEECHYCHKKGHIASVCRQKAKRQQSHAGPTHTVADSSDTDPPEYPMYTVDASQSQPISVQVHLNGTPVNMEMDTGATMSIMSKHTYQSTWSTSLAPPLQPTKARLRT